MKNNTEKIKRLSLMIVERDLGGSLRDFRAQGVVIR
jgi:hypothetical protein